VRETSTIKQGEGTDPHWSNETHFFAHDKEDKRVKDDSFLIQVYSDNLFDKLIGEFTISWSKLQEFRDKNPDWHNLFDKGGQKEQRGEVLLKIFDYNPDKAFGTQQTFERSGEQTGAGMRKKGLNDIEVTDKDRQEIDRMRERGHEKPQPTDLEKNKGQILPQHEKDKQKDMTGGAYLGAGALGGGDRQIGDRQNETHHNRQDVMGGKPDINRHDTQTVDKDRTGDLGAGADHQNETHHNRHDAIGGKSDINRHDTQTVGKDKEQTGREFYCPVDDNQQMSNLPKERIDQNPNQMKNENISRHQNPNQINENIPQHNQNQNQMNEGMPPRDHPHNQEHVNLLPHSKKKSDDRDTTGGPKMRMEGTTNEAEMPKHQKENMNEMNRNRTTNDSQATH